MQNKKIVQCENCYKFFDEDAVSVQLVKRVGMIEPWTEDWCAQCIDRVNKGVNIDVIDLSTKLTQLLFSQAEEKTREIIKQNIQTFLSTELGIVKLDNRRK